MHPARLCAPLAARDRTLAHNAISCKCQRGQHGRQGDDPVSSYPSVDESFDRLHHAGWSIGEAGGVAVWIVTGTNGENMIRAEGHIQAEAWWRACEQAAAVGMLAPARPTGPQGRFPAYG
jgi:hypothetical protein